ncbi:MAG: 6-phosphofructokinase [Vicinamibacteria bacterium]
MKIGVLTSGGDAPGMNAAIRSVVRVASSRDSTVVGFRRGYSGLIQGNFHEVTPRGVANILQRGGTILKTERSAEFLDPEGRQKARRVLERNEIAGLVTIGGDGTFRGAHELSKIWKGGVVGVPATIDNDVFGSDETIGFDTALDTALDAIDKIRDTATSHERLFLVEVMGRRSGFIALGVCTAGGAEDIFVPEVSNNLDACCERLVAARKRGKAMSILIVAEGEHEGGAFAVAEKLKAKTGFDYRVTVLGHIQRGGSPTARDRILATKLGAYAVEAIAEGKTDVMVGEIAGRLSTTPLEETWSRKKELDPYLLKLIPVLSR